MQFYHKYSVCNHHQNQDTECLYPWAATDLFSISIILSFQECFINGILKYEIFGVQHFSLSILETHPSCCIYINTLFLLLLGNSPLPGIPHFVYPFSHWESFRLSPGLIITNMATMHIFIYWFLCEHQFSFLWDKCSEAQLFSCTYVYLVL